MKIKGWLYFHLGYFWWWTYQEFYKHMSSTAMTLFGIWITSKIHVHWFAYVAVTLIMILLQESVPFLVVSTCYQTQIFTHRKKCHFIINYFHYIPPQNIGRALCWFSNYECRWVSFQDSERFMAGQVVKSGGEEI